MKKALYIIPTLLLLAAVLIVFNSRFFLPRFLSAIFSKQLKAEVRIDKAAFHFRGTKGIKIEGVHINNQRSLSCSIESAAIETNLFFSNLGFELEGVSFSYPDSAVVDSIARTLSLEQPDLLKFDTASGRLSRKNKKLIVKALNASGKHIRLFIDGTITDDSRINASFRMLLSRELVANIPETTRKVFFKQDGSWSKAELYLSGDIQHPSINFSTDLFKLIVRGPKSL